jgi:hypothetical protein
MASAIAEQHTYALVLAGLPRTRAGGVFVTILGSTCGDLRGHLTNEQTT